MVGVQTGDHQAAISLDGVKVKEEWLPKWQNSAMYVAMPFQCQILGFAVNVESRDWDFEELSMGLLIH